MYITSGTGVNFVPLCENRIGYNSASSKVAL